MLDRDCVWPMEEDETAGQVGVPRKPFATVSVVAMEVVHVARSKVVRNTTEGKASARRTEAAISAKYRDVARRTKEADCVLPMAAAKSAMWRDARHHVLEEVAARHMEEVDAVKLMIAAIGLSMADDVRSTAERASAAPVVGVTSTTKAVASALHMVVASPARSRTAQKSRYATRWSKVDAWMTLADGTCLLCYF